MRRRVTVEGFFVGRAFAIACCAALLLAACGDEVQEPAPPPTSVAQAAPDDGAARAAQQTEGMTDGMPIPGKPGAPVTMKFEVQGEPSAGNPVAVDIAFLPQAASSLLRVTFIATDGLALDAPDAQPEFRDVKADGVYRHTLTVTPREDGEYYVGVIVLMNLANGPEVRTFNIPVPVGDAAKSRTAAHESPPPPVDATGQAIQSMKAQPAGPQKKD